MSLFKKRIIIFIGVVVLFIGIMKACSSIIQDTRPVTTDKPVIYLYPEEEQEVSVELFYNGKLTCTYPEYRDGWVVIARPDGTLTNLEDRRQYSYLFWEGTPHKTDWDLSKGFVIKGEDTKDFLQNKLSEMGLTPKEYNEFIVYWLPHMQDHEYNLIHFASDCYEELAKLEINPKPDSILRIFMVFKPLHRHMEVEEQIFPEFQREGFSVIEWGGTQLK